MNDQKIWLVALGTGAVVLVLGILLHGWLHGSEPKAAAADEESPKTNGASWANS